MAKQFFTFLMAAVIALTASIAVAQDEDGFCDMRSNGLLAELEGTWTFKQSAGYGIGGTVLPFPLPPQPPQQVNLEYDAETGVIFMRHAGESMALIEVSFDYSEAGVFFLTPDEKEILRAQETNCDLNRVPTLIGTNSYALDSGGYTGNKIVISDGDISLEACAEFDPLLDTIAVTDSDGNLISYIEASGRVMTAEDFEPEDWVTIEDETRNQRCSGDFVEGVPGDIVLALVLQFGSPNWATGIIQFRVQIPGASGAARAPVTLTRNSE